MTTISADLRGVGVPSDSRSEDAVSLLRRIRAEYAEMPGLNLTVPQAARLWNTDRESVRTVLSRLLADGFLIRTTKGIYRREACPRCA